MARPVKGIPLRDEAYQRIRQRIISLEMPPGATIDETELQETLGLGRTPIREALLRLSQEHLVVIVPRRGMFVSDVSLIDLRQLFEVRLVMETMAVQLAVERGTDEQWQEMERILNDLPEPGTPGENEIMLQIDEQCHHLIYQACGNRFLASTLSPLFAQSVRLWYLLLNEIRSVRPAIVEHIALLEALKDGDEARAVQFIQQHIDGFQEEIQLAMLGQTGSQTDPIT